MIHSTYPIFPSINKVHYQLPVTSTQQFELTYRVTARPQGNAKKRDAYFSATKPTNINKDNPTPKQTPQKKKRWGWKAILAFILFGPKGGVGIAFVLGLLKNYIPNTEVLIIPVIGGTIATAIISGRRIKKRLPQSLQDDLTQGAKPLILHLPFMKKALVIRHISSIKPVSLQPKKKPKKEVNEEDAPPSSNHAS